jgi:hypothetical protein
MENGLKFSQEALAQQRCRKHYAVWDYQKKLIAAKDATKQSPGPV